MMNLPTVGIPITHNLIPKTNNNPPLANTIRKMETIASSILPRCWRNNKLFWRTDTYLVSCNFGRNSLNHRFLPSLLSLKYNFHIPLRNIVHQSSMFCPGGILIFRQRVNTNPCFTRGREEFLPELWCLP